MTPLLFCLLLVLIHACRLSAAQSIPLVLVFLCLRADGDDAVFNRQRYGPAWIITSTDKGKTWNLTATPTDMFPGRLAAPRFVQYGQDFSGAPDDWVYLSSEQVSLSCHSSYSHSTREFFDGPGMSTSQERRATAPSLRTTIRFCWPASTRGRFSIEVRTSFSTAFSSTAQQPGPRTRPSRRCVRNAILSYQHASVLRLSCCALAGCVGVSTHDVNSASKFPPWNQTLHLRELGVDLIRWVSSP